MARIIVDIPDETYEYVKQNYRYGIGAEVACKLGFAVAEGAPLPKGHGRLIDADEFKSDILTIIEPDLDRILDYLTDAPTIIDADKEIDNG